MILQTKQHNMDILELNSKFYLSFLYEMISVTVVDFEEKSYR
jgi:hypothetical protein